MTVKELIQHLQQYPEDMRVVVTNPVGFAEIDTPKPTVRKFKVTSGLATIASIGEHINVPIEECLDFGHD